MANYMRTYLRISGSKSDVESAIDSIFDGDTLALEKLKPIPEAINSDVSAGWLIKDIDYKSLTSEGLTKALEGLKQNKYKWHEKVVKQEGNKFWYVNEREEIPDQRIFNDSQIAAIVKSVEDTGYPSREEFVNEQWGSGYCWQRDEKRPEIEEYNNGYKAAIHFESKWAAPMYLIEKLSRLYPNLIVYVSLSLEMEYNTHVMLYKNGVRTSEFWGDNSYVFYGDGGNKFASEGSHEITIYDTSQDCLMRFDNAVMDYLDTVDDATSILTTHKKSYELKISWKSIINADEFVRQLIEDNANDNALIEYKETASLPISVDDQRFEVIRDTVIHGTNGDFNGFAVIVENEFIDHYNNKKAEDKSEVAFAKENEDISDSSNKKNDPFKKYALKPADEFDEDKWFIIDENGEKVYNQDQNIPF